MTSRPVRFATPRPHCPDPRCDKVWAPTRRAAREIRADILREKGDPDQPVRYYEHAGGWHWTRLVEKPRGYE